MSTVEKIQQGYLILFSTLYVFAFRGAARDAALLGAFEFRSRALVVRKLLFSLVILALLPAAAYSVLARFVVGSVPATDTSTLRWYDYSILPTIAVFVAGLFPWACFHAWSLITCWHTRHGVSEGQRGYGWLNTARSAKAPLVWQYSLQVLLLWIFLIAVVVLAGGLDAFKQESPFKGAFGIQMFTVLYLSQLVVLFQVSKERGFYEHKPKWILSKRMLVTIPVTVVLPCLFGAFGLYPVVVDLDRGNIGLWALILLGIAFPFPHYCHQSMLLAAKRFDWKTKNAASPTDGIMASEIDEALPFIWKVYLAMALVSLTMVSLLRIFSAQELQCYSS